MFSPRLLVFLASAVVAFELPVAYTDPVYNQYVTYEWIPYTQVVSACSLTSLSEALSAGDNRGKTMIANTWTGPEGGCSLQFEDSMVAPRRVAIDAVARAVQRLQRQGRSDRIDHGIQINFFTTRSVIHPQSIHLASIRILHNNAHPDLVEGTDEHEPAGSHLQWWDQLKTSEDDLRESQSHLRG